MNNPLRILFLNQYYWPDSAATAQILTDLAESLVERGHRVTVVCSAGWYDKPVGPAKGSERPLQEIHKGVEIVRLKAASFGRRSKFSQLVDFGSFHLLVAGYLLRHAGEFDVVVSLTTPPLVAVWGSAVRAVWPGVRHVHWCMNLHPDVEVEMGVVKGLPARVLREMTRWQVRNSDVIVSLGECMTRRLLAKAVSQEKIVRIPMWALNEMDLEGVGDFRREWGLEGKFVVLHAGNAGAICDFRSVQEAAQTLKGDERFVFLFTGGGRRIREIEAFAAEHGLGNLRTAPYVAREQLPRLLQTGDIHLASLRMELAGTSVPSKVYGIMAMGKPLIFIGSKETETANAIERYRCGYTVETGEVEEFVGRLKALADKPDLRETLGASGREGYRAEYNAAVCCGEWAGLLEEVGRSGARARS